MSNNTVIQFTLDDLCTFIDLRERAAQIDILKRVKVLGNGERIEKLIRRIEEGTLNEKVVCKSDVKKNRIPREVKVIVESTEFRKDYSDIEQYMVRSAE